MSNASNITSAEREVLLDTRGSQWGRGKGDRERHIRNQTSFVHSVVHVQCGFCF